MKGGDRIFVADGPYGSVYAAVVPDVGYVQPRVGDLKLSAFLAPFRSEEEARAALDEAGGADIREIGR